MTQDERLKDILQYLKEAGAIRVEEICERYQVSRDTARRDLVKLEEKQLITRTHGGAVLPSYNPDIRRYELRSENLIGKQAIGQKAASLVEDGEILLLDTSTTIQWAAEALTARNLTVVTNSIDVASTLGKKGASKLHLLGGQFNAWHRNVTGMETLEQLRHYHVKTVFIGACGMTLEGLNSPSVEEAYLKREMIRRSDRVIVLADYSKFNKRYLHDVCGLEEIDMLITDIEPPAYMREALQQHDIQIITSNGGDGHDN